DGESSTGSADDHHAAGEPDGDSGTDSELHSSRDRHGAAQLPVAEERSEYRGGHGQQLYDACNNDFRQRLDVPRGGHEHSGDGNQQHSDSDGEPSTGSANDHYAAGEPDGDRGTDSELHSSRDRHGAAQLPVAEKRGEQRRGDIYQLQDTGNH